MAKFGKHWQNMASRLWQIMAKYGRLWQKVAKIAKFAKMVRIQTCPDLSRRPQTCRDLYRPVAVRVSSTCPVAVQEDISSLIKQSSFLSENSIFVYSISGPLGPLGCGCWLQVWQIVRCTRLSYAIVAVAHKKICHNRSSMHLFSSTSMPDVFDD